MLSLRKEIKNYSSSCEHLIAEAASADAVPFTLDEIEVIKYYVSEMTGLVDQLVRKSQSQVPHDRQSIQSFAVASEAVFLMDGFSKGGKDSIRHSVSDIRAEILDGKEHPASER